MGVDLHVAAVDPAQLLQALLVRRMILRKSDQTPNAKGTRNEAGPFLNLVAGERSQLGFCSAAMVPGHTECAETIAVPKGSSDLKLLTADRQGDDFAFQKRRLHKRRNLHGEET